MFTDQPVTPVRLEVLLNLLLKYTNGLKRDVIYDLLQPTPLCNDSKKTASLQTVSAALQLGLVVENKSAIKLAKEFNKRISVKENILKSADNNVLANLDVELHLALFYSYYLGMNKQVYSYLEDSREDWAHRFNTDVFANEPQPNQFNATKYTGLDRWFSYLGLGWYDSQGHFQANPYERLLRALDNIFEKKSKLQTDEFMLRLANICSELDCGQIFLQANQYQNYNPEEKQCSLGLSQALIGLHEDGILRLDCPIDSRGWNISFATPPRDDSILSDRITQIEYIRK